MATINTLQAIAKLTEANDIYIRYSRSPSKDIKRGYSLDHSTGTAHAGLSVQSITRKDCDEGNGWLARLVSEYAFLRMGGARGWLARGTVVAKDSDGCPVIRDVEVIGRVAPKLIDQCVAYSLALDARNRSDRGCADTRPWPQPEQFGL